MKNTILLAMRALPVLAARRILNLLPVLAVVGFAAALTACGKQMSDGERAAVFVPVVAAAAIIGTSGKNSGNAPATMTENPAPLMTMTNPAPTMSVTMPEPMQPAEPVTLSLNSPEAGGFFYRGLGVRNWFVILSVAPEGETTVLFGNTIMLSRMSVNTYTPNSLITLPEFNRASLHATGDLVPLVENGMTVIIPAFTDAIAFEMVPTITALAQLCPVPWLATYIRETFVGNLCPVMGGMSYSPQMQQVIYAAMAEGFNRGVGIGESPFAFSGRYDGDNRSAGFTYAFGGYALRTDYIRLPSRQDSEVWLDTYRFGALTRLNDETQFFAGIDNYRNAIIVMDTNGNNGNNQHRLGFAVGEGYAIKYEYRLNL